MECLQCAGLHAKHFACLVLINPHSNPPRCTYYYLHSSRGNWGSEKQRPHLARKWQGQDMKLCLTTMLFYLPPLIWKETLRFGASLFIDWSPLSFLKTFFDVDHF